jgi:hypothetical protein
MRNRHFVPSSIINTIRAREKLRDQRLAQPTPDNREQDEHNTAPNPVIREAVSQLFVNPAASTEPVFEFTREAVQQAKL